MATEPWESTSVTTPQAWATSLSVWSRQWRRWSSTWSAKACSTPKTPRPSTAGWTTRKPSEAGRWRCATMTRLRPVPRTRLRVWSPGCAPNPSGSSASTCLSTAQTTGWFKSCVQTTAPRIHQPIPLTAKWRFKHWWKWSSLKLERCVFIIALCSKSWRHEVAIKMCSFRFST